MLARRHAVMVASAAIPSWSARRHRRHRAAGRAVVALDVLDAARTPPPSCPGRGTVIQAPAELAARCLRAYLAAKARGRV